MKLKLFFFLGLLFTLVLFTSAGEPGNVKDESKLDPEWHKKNDAYGCSRCSSEADVEARSTQENGYGGGGYGGGGYGGGGHGGGGHGGSGHGGGGYGSGGHGGGYHGGCKHGCCYGGYGGGCKRCCTAAEAASKKENESKP